MARTDKGPAELLTLFEQAARHGMHVHLSVEPGRPLGPKGKEYRHLSRLAVWDPRNQRALGARAVVGNDVGRAAARLLEAV
jgi:hypothetical protein